MLSKMINRVVAKATPLSRHANRRAFSNELAAVQFAKPAADGVMPPSD